MHNIKKISLFLDSGAFSAWSKNVNISIDEYIEFIKNNIDYIDVYSVLDDIIDAEKTWQNQIYMEEQGLSPLPCFHYGEDLNYLKKYISNYDYISLGGMVPIASKNLRVWLDNIFINYICDKNGMPKVKIHGFGMTSLDLMIRYPWYCMTEEDHTVLTKSGWKELKDLKLKEEILAFNDGKMEWQEIQEIPIFEVKNQEIEHLYNRNFDAFVTGNHRWKVFLDRDRKKIKKKYYWKTTDTLENKDAISRVGNNYSFLKKKVLTDEQVGLLAWFWTDGSIKKRPNYNEDSIVIYQSENVNSKKCEIIRNLLTKSKEKFCESKSKRDGIIGFEFYGEISKWLLSFAPEKQLPVDLPLLLTKKQAEMFINYSILADGNKTGLKRTNGFGITVKRNAKKENLEILRIICLLLGIPTSIYLSGSNKESKCLLSSSVQNIYLSDINKEKKKYTGRLWCVRVSSGAFFTKCNNKIYVTGNSVDSTSWVQTGRFGSVYVPKFRRGKYIYNENSWKVTVSNRSPSQKDEGQHFSTFSKMEQEIILSYFHEKGFDIGKSEYRKENKKTYKLKENERWLNQDDADSCRELIENLGTYVPPEKLAMRDIVETIIEPGLSNDYKLRDELNIIYFLDLEKSMPKWPWPLKLKKNIGFDL